MFPIVGLPVTLQLWNGAFAVEKGQNGGRLTQCACPTLLSMRPIFAGRGPVISGRLSNRFGSRFGTNTKLLRGVELLTYCPQCPLAWRATAKVLHSCLFWASFRMVPQVWFRVLTSPFTVHRQVFFGLPLFRLPFGVQCRTVRVMLSMCPILVHLLLMMMVSMLSWRQRASSCSFDMVLGRKILRILRRLFVWKMESSHPPTLWVVLQGRNYTALVQLQLGLCAVLLGPPNIVEHSEGIPGLAKTVLYIITCSSITSNSAA